MRKLFFLRIKHYIIIILLLMISNYSSTTNNSTFKKEKIYFHFFPKNHNIFIKFLCLKKKKRKNKIFGSLFENYKKCKIGDTITVFLQENDKLTNDFSLIKDEKENNSLGLQFGVEPVRKIFMNINEPNHITGLNKTKDNQKNEINEIKNILDGKITVFITKIFKNGNLKIFGEKKLYINKINKIIQFEGIINKKFITNENTISSMNVSQLTIKYFNYEKKKKS